MTDQKRENGHPTPLMLMSDCNRLFHHRMRKFADESGVPYGYRSLLMHLGFAEEHGQTLVTQLELARQAHLTPPTVSVSLSKMEQDGYIVRVPDENDMRQIHVSLTDKGRAINKANIEHADCIDRMAVEGLSDEEVAELKRLLLRIADNLSRGLPCPCKNDPRKE